MQGKVRSFVRRDSRITPAQARALAEHRQTYGFQSADYAEPDPEVVQIIEIGAGDGDCALHIAARNPFSTYLAVEVYRPGLGRLLAGTHRLGLTNLVVADADVTDLLTAIGGEVFDQVLIFFPDPWPKKRHHKRRLVKTEFLDALAPKVARSGRLYIATDIADYAHNMLDALDKSSIWENLAGTGKYAPRPRFRPLTKFERKGLSAGREIYELTAARRSLPLVRPAR